MAVEMSKMASQLVEAAEKMSEQQSAGTSEQMPSGTQGQVQEQDASRFREVMSQQPQATNQVAGTQAQSVQASQAAQPGQAAAVSDPQGRSMGDAILDKLQQTSKQNADMLKSVENIAESDGDISVSSMLQVQTEMMKLQITEEVETKAEGKVDQTLETLLKS